MQYKIHSFGYGRDHDEEWLTTISDFKRGKYYYVKNIARVDEYILDTLGALLSVVGKEAEIEVTLGKYVSFQKFYELSWEK